MKRFVFAIALIVAVAAMLTLTPPANACDDVAALSSQCYSQPIRQRVKVIERIEVPRYVERQRIIERQYVPAERIVERQKIVRQRSGLAYGALLAPARVVERIAVPRGRSVRRERIVERSTY